MDAQAPAFMQFIPLVIMFVIFYFLLIRPQQSKQKAHEKMLAEIQKNDEIVTAGGVHATVVGVNDKTFSIRIADNVKIEIEKTSIATLKKKKD